jgi:hypothetical protein
VCADPGVTTDPRDPRLAPLATLQPADAALPYRYAISNGAPMYARLPTRAEQARAERWLGAAGSYEKYPWNRGHERLAEERRIAPDGPLPAAWLARAQGDGQRDPVARSIPLGSMLAYTRAFEHEGRTFVLSADGTFAPADRLRPFRASSFSGRTFGASDALPLAWTRPAAVSWSAAPHEEPIQGASWPARSLLFLDPAASERSVRASKLWQTRERRGNLLAFVDAKQAWRALPERPPAKVRPDEKWIHVSISRGTLVAASGPCSRR